VTSNSRAMLSMLSNAVPQMSNKLDALVIRTGLVTSFEASTPFNQLSIYDLMAIVVLKLAYDPQSSVTAVSTPSFCLQINLAKKPSCKMPTLTRNKHA
jgi:hypothetical protein